MRFIIAVLLSTFLFLAGPAHAVINAAGCMGTNISKTVTLPAGTKTAAIYLGCYTLVGVQFGTFTGTALTFETSSAIDGTFVAVKATTGGTALSYTVAQNSYSAIDPVPFYGLSIIKLVSGSTESADRTLILYLKGL